MSGPAELAIETPSPGVRLLRLSRPARRNALSPALIRALDEALIAAQSDDTRVLVFTGEGEQAFCAGYDVEALAPPSHTGELPDDALQDLFRAIEEHPAPSIALVQGAIFGAGCELAAACDFRVGVATAVFCVPPAKLGIVYADEGIQRLVRLVGLSRAKRMFLTGRKVDAATALEWGLLDELAPDAAAARVWVDGLAAELGSGAPLAVSGMKRTFATLGRAALDDETREALRAVRAASFASEDAKEGRAAFLERRPPVFRGR